MKCQKELFNLNPDLTYLNCAYMSPQLKTVTETGIRALLRKEDPTSIFPVDFFEPTEQLRSLFATMIEADDPKRIVTIPSVSYGMAIVSRNISLNADDEILVVGEQFPSNIYPWTRLAKEKGAKLLTVPSPPPMEGRGDKWNLDILDAIGPATRIIAIPHVHWADGTFFDLLSISQKAKSFGALLIVDGTQSVGALPFSVKKVQPDALICAGYKWLMGPYSLGLAYLGPAFDEGFPLEENWINRLNSEDFGGLVRYQEDYQPGSLRYEVGEHSNFILVPMLTQALRQIQEWGVENIQEYLLGIGKAPLQRLRDKGVWVEKEGAFSPHLFGIAMPDLAQAKEKLLQNKVHVSYRGHFVRVSPHVYNREEDLQRLVDILLGGG
ncbi:aminotransferase class V-fold PLP-dependent enzyme [Pleomorphovibrio marinus]|uniref:aminotransferase class V-fold PLP-dependent enzyme n=1 Tax=Pleomorphovibrio marinus TaxID=2164132 RepID=UPI000E0A41F5|nr:aminotransferase class V-fold PLP-dependent enzyme [Pleomorphovibrio marinus]